MLSSASSQLFVLTEENRSVKGSRWIRLLTERLQSQRSFTIASGVRIRAQNPTYLEEVMLANAVIADNVVAVAAGNPPDPVPPINADPNGEPLPPAPIAPGAAAAIRDAFFNDRKNHMDVLKMLRDDRREYDDHEAMGLQILFEWVDESFKASIPMVQRTTLPAFWTAIVRKVNQRTGTELAHLTSTYHTLKQSKDQSLEAYRLLRRDYEESLDNAGLPIPPQVQKSSFLSSLLPVYRNSADIYHDNPMMDIDQCVIALKGLELRINHTREVKNQNNDVNQSTISKLKSEIKALKASKTNSAPMSLNVSNLTRKDTKNKDKKSNAPVCIFCNMRGHSESQCRGKQRPCDICHQMGHHRNNCKNKSNINSAVAQSSDNNSDQDEFGLMTEICPDTEFTLSEITSFHKTSEDFSDYIISDSGCTHTCTSSPHFIESIHKSNPNMSLIMANGKREPVSSIGCVGILKDVLLVENLQVDLLSVPQLDNMGFSTTYGQGKCIISQNGNVISIGVLYNKHYFHPKSDFNKGWIMTKPHTDINSLLQQYKVLHSPISTADVPSEPIVNPNAISNPKITLHDRIMITHKRLGHMSYTKMLHSLKSDIIHGTGISYEELKSHGPFVCHSCIIAKMKRLPRYPSTSQNIVSSIPPGSKWGVDLKTGLTKTLTGETMTLSCVDFGSGATYHFPMKHKNEATCKLLLLNNFVKTSHFSLDNISVIQSDDEPIFTSGAFADKCQELHIGLQHSSPYIKEQNGLIESAIKTDFAMARALIYEAKVKPYLWNHALRYVSYIRFRTIGSPIYGHNVSPYFLWYKSHPDVSHIRTWGSPVYHHNPSELRTSAWDPKSYLGILLGIVPNTKYCYYVAKLSPPFTIYQRSDILILEDIPVANPFMDAKIIQDNNTLLSVQPLPRKYLYSPKHSSPDVILSQVDQDSHGYFITTADDSLLLAANQPQLYLDQAMRHPAREHFLTALREEFDNLNNLGVFRFVNKSDIPKDTKIIPLMAVFKVKTITNDSKVKVKSRIVVLGNKMDRYGMITFSPTVQNFTTLLFFGLVVQLQYVCISTDFVQAYLHARSRPGIFVSISPYMTSGPEMYAELQYALYGIPDSGKIFNDHLHDFVSRLGYTRSLVDPCLYFKSISDKDLIIFILYVDDIAVQGPSLDAITTHFLQPLKSNFRMTQEDQISNYLSMHIQYDTNNHILTLDQSSYTNSILDKFGVTKGKLVPVPTQLPASYTADTPTIQMPTNLMEQVGSLRYLADHTRPDIQYSTNRAVTDITGTFALQTFQYLSTTSHSGLQFKYDEQGIHLHGFADATWKVPPLSHSFISYVLY